MSQEQKSSECAVIVGIGPGLGRSLARKFASEGYNIALVSRRKESMDPVEKSILNDYKNVKVVSIISDVTDSESIKNGHKKILSSNLGVITVLCYNVGPPVKFPFPSFLDVKLEDINLGLNTVSGAFLWSQLVLPKMLENKFGSILFTGATAALRGGAKFTTLAVSKFALRALSQSIAREFQPKGKIFGVQLLLSFYPKLAEMIDRYNRFTLITFDRYENVKKNKEEYILPDSIADTYYMIHKQPKNCWAQELDLRPHVEKF